MPLYTVKQGDYLGRIAAEHGFANWKTIYDHPQNGDFRKKRPHPDLIYPGDQLFIPERDAKRVPIATGKSHKVEVNLSRHRIKVRVTEPTSRDHFAGRPYVLILGSKEHRGNIPGSGVIDHELPPSVTKGNLRVLPFDGEQQSEFTRELEIGHLDPIETVTGVQARLHNLGYAPGPVDGIAGPLTRRGVEAFQERHDLEVDGIVGPKTRQKLTEVYGC